MLWLFRILMAALLIFGVACGKKNNSNLSKKNAATPIPTNECMNVDNYSYNYNGYYRNGQYDQNYRQYSNQTCLYDYSRHQGFQNYIQTGFGFSDGLCGCQNGYSPVYNNAWGLGCVSSQYAPQTAIYYTWNTFNGQWVNMPLTPPSIPSTGSCMMDSLYACDPALANSCGVQGQCLAVGGSRLGICQYRNGYSYGYQGYQYSGGFTNGR